VCREGRPEDVEGLLALKNAVFPPITRKDWDREKNKTVVVALENDRIIGAVPFALRKFRIAPGVVIRSAFENSVGVVEDRRGGGIGTMMLECAHEFLRDRVDAMMVYRGDEQSAPYRFYIKTGHVPVHRPRELAWSPEGDAGVPAIALEDAPAIIAAREELLDLFCGTWGTWAGFPERDASCWSRALDSYIFAELKHVPKLLRMGEGGETTAYAIVSLTKDTMRIDEMAARGEESAAVLVDEILHHAAVRSARVVVYSVDNLSPFDALYKSRGFVPRARSLSIMAKLIDPESFVRKRFRSKSALEGIGVRVWTPRREFVIQDAPDGRSVTLEMTEEALTRWAMSRLDFAGALNSEEVTVLDAGKDDIEELKSAFPLSPWVYHSLDDI